MLGPYRVLDLTDDGALLCGQILADLGADVIQVEPPGGAAARSREPFAGATPDPEGSLVWWAWARGKRGVVIDLERAEGRAELLALARGADFVIESFAPGTLGRLGLGYDALARANPALILVSITPFGQTGPKAGWAATDLTLMASSGALVLTGDEDRAPVRVTIPQAWLHGGAEAAVGALIALHERLHSGRGQHVDVSVQQAAMLATQSTVLATLLGGTPQQRMAAGTRAGPLRLRFAFPAKDGFVSITHLFGSAIGPATRRLMDWVCEAGFCDEAMRDKDWVGYGSLLLEGKEPLEEFERVKATVARFTASKTKAELFQGALDRGILLAPVSTVRDVVESEQLGARGYFQELERGGRSARYPGPFAKFGAAPIRYGRAAPRLGEHDAEVRGEVRAAPRVTPVSAAEGDLPLAGVKVLDFMWAVAGPAATRTLADYGATVVRIESTRRLDVCRTIHPFLDDVPGAERSGLFHSTNVGKRMLTLDPTKPQGCAVVRDLVRWADVVTESFTPRGMKGFGLPYETLREIKPDLIMLSTCLMGQTGPLARFAGFGNLAAAYAGFYDVTGWPDRPPAGPFGAYTDYVAPRFNACAILAALEHRRRTGEGQHIDLSQAEAALHFLAPALLDYTVNGVVTTRDGNRDPHLRPHGVFPCAGDDRWVALACRDETDREALRAELGGANLSDEAIAAYTSVRPAEEVEARLQARGVPASVVQGSPECVRDPQLLYRNHFIPVTHPDRPAAVEASRFTLSRTPARTSNVAPTFGLDTQWVLETLLGYDDDRIAELVIAGALE